jgi:hypothetical protein
MEQACRDILWTETLLGLTFHVSLITCMCIWLCAYRFHSNGQSIRTEQTYCSKGHRTALDHRLEM